MGKASEHRPRASAAATRLAAWMRPYRLPVGVALGLGALCAVAITSRAGEPALPLDDAFIHLQYARRLAEGHWFSYAPGDGYSSGATSLVWPLIIAPCFVLGMDGLAVVWAVWLLGAVMLGAVALETSRLARGLTSPAAAAAAGAMCLAFGAFAWFAMSGMETIAFAWVLVRGARAASEACETPQSEASWRALVALAVLAPLVRPEGVAVSAMALGAALWHWRRGSPWTLGQKLGRVLVPLAAPLIVPAMHWVLSGSPSSSTAFVKWLPLDPYVDLATFGRETGDNAALLVRDLLNGGVWTGIFVPSGFVYPLALGVVALPIAGWRRGRGARALFVLLALASTFMPCTYATMLWNRVRYIWPFAPLWFIALGALGSELGALAAKLRPALEAVGSALSWAGVAVLAVHLPWSVRDLAQSARAIALQQVALGRWAGETLGQEAVIGVNDTGAIAYMSGRRTFDVVGLTTLGEARYWAEGVGSRFEHYERLPRERLPSHFIVYPNWMQLPAVLGARLTEATVIDQSILGGTTMVAYEARYDLLGSGARPFALPGDGALLAELDVADVDSEAEYRYRRGPSAARFDVATLGEDERGGEVADGGRIERVDDRFELGPMAASSMVMRVSAPAPLEVWLGARRLGEARTVAATPTWEERAIDLPALGAVEVVVVRSTEPVRFASYHYWWLGR